MSLALYYAVFPDVGTAERICRQLIEEKRLACANLLPAHQAIYPWKGQVESSTEIPAILKGDSSRHADLETRYLELHPYEVPCLIRLSVDGVNAEYGHWVRELLILS